MNRYLFHHGVKGMRWGVVKKKLKKGESIRIDQLNKRAYSKLIKSGKDFTIAKGSQSYRFTSRKNEIKKGSKYVSYRFNNTSLSYLNYLISANTNTKKDYIYRDVYENNNDIKVAGYKNLNKIGKEFTTTLIEDARSKQGSLERQKFINEFRKRGYDATIDPVYFRRAFRKRDVGGTIVLDGSFIKKKEQHKDGKVPNQYIR